MNTEDEIVKRLVDTRKWGKPAARKGFRSGFKCTYCDRDLLASVNDYKSWQEDHIIPTSAGGEDEESNIAISCRTCNFNIKANWDPRINCGENPTREELIQATREYISEKRAKLLTDVAMFRSIVYENNK